MLLCATHAVCNTIDRSETPVPQVFQEAELLVNITQHVLVPKHQVCLRPLWTCVRRQESQSSSMEAVQMSREYVVSLRSGDRSPLRSEDRSLQACSTSSWAVRGVALWLRGSSTCPRHLERPKTDLRAAAGRC